MEKAFKDLIKSRFPYLGSSKLLLAVSGGVDSVVLAHLCKKANLDFSIAHCNFNLRDEESDADEIFVADLAETLDVKVFIQSFDTEKYAEEAKISIQMAARDLRYNWFEELNAAFKFDCILTAHHANDNLETFLINLVRGTGLEGLTGIKVENEKIVRPLMDFTRSEIEGYAKKQKIQWREDSSNASSKYLRNQIRHQIVPVLEEMNPQFLNVFSQTQAHLQESFDLVEDYMGLLYSRIISNTSYGFQLNIEVLEKIPNTRAVLYQLLKSFGFTEWDDVFDLLKAQPGKLVFSDTHRLIKDRGYLLLTEKPSIKENLTYKIPGEEEIVMLPIGTFSLNEVEEISETSRNCIYVDKQSLDFPLTLRKWREGDYFYPFGMKGKKKLSDYFQDKKLSLPEKEEVWLLCSGDNIVWVVNHRADARFAIKSPAQKILKITSSI